METEEYKYKGHEIRVILLDGGEGERRNFSVIRGDGSDNESMMATCELTNSRGKDWSR